MSDARWGRFGAVCGIVFAVLFTLGMILPDLPGGGAAPETVTEFYADSGNRTTIIIAAYILAIAGIAFLAFVTSLHRGLRSVEGSAGSLSTLALGGGVVFVAMLYVTSTTWATVPAGVEIGGEAAPSAEIPVWLAQIGYGSLLLHGMFAAIVMIVSTSVLTLRVAILPRWMAWTGFVCAFILLFGVMFLPMIALPIWTIAASIAMLKNPVADTSQNMRATAATG